MSERTWRMALWTAAGTSLALGLLLSLWAARSAGAAKAGLARQINDLGRLQAVQADLGRYEAAYAAFDRLQALPAVPVNDLLREVIGDGKAAEVRDISLHSAPGWMLHRKEVVFGQIAVAKAMEFARRAETPSRTADGQARTPWRVAKCVIRPDSAGGDGQVTLVLETLAKEEQHGPVGANQE